MSKSSKPKVYQGVLEEIRTYIQENHLYPGDKLPSERELAEKLQAGRSSIREALRALELLGLIETRHGEGTFLRSYRSLQSVELLSSFILLEDRTRKELIETKRIIEKEAIKLAMPKTDSLLLKEIETFLKDDHSAEEKHLYFFTTLLSQSDNQLLLKIWTLMEEFSLSIRNVHYEPSFYFQLLEIIAMEDYDALESLYEQQGHQMRDQ